MSIEVIGAFVLGAVIGGVVMAFFYSNNKKDVDPIIKEVNDYIDTKIDPVFEKLNDKIDVVQEKVKEVKDVIATPAPKTTAKRKTVAKK